jgi:hypothetical protein
MLFGNGKRLNKPHERVGKSEVSVAVLDAFGLVEPVVKPRYQTLFSALSGPCSEAWVALFLEGIDTRGDVVNDIYHSPDLYWSSVRFHLILRRTRDS